MLPVEGGGLDTDTGSGDTLDSHWSVVLSEPLGGRWSVGKEEIEEYTEEDGERSEDVEDELPSGNGLIAHGGDTGGHEGTDHSSPSDGRVPDSLTERNFLSAVPPSGHEGETGSDSGFEDTEEESSDHDVGEVLRPDHDEDHDTPDERGSTEDSTGMVTTKEVRPSWLGDHVTTALSAPGQKQDHVQWCLGRQSGVSCPVWLFAVISFLSCSPPIHHSLSAASYMFEACRASLTCRKWPLPSSELSADAKGREWTEKVGFFIQPSPMPRSSTHVLISSHLHGFFHSEDLGVV